MMDKYIARVTEVADEMAALLAEALEAEELGHEFSQRELRVRFEQLKRINGDLGQVQFEFTNDPIWPLLDEQDRQDWIGAGIDFGGAHGAQGDPASPLRCLVAMKHASPNDLVR